MFMLSHTQRIKMFITEVFFLVFKIPVNIKQCVNWVNNAFVCIQIYKLLKCITNTINWQRLDFTFSYMFSFSKLKSIVIFGGQSRSGLV